MKIGSLEERGVLEEITGRRRNRVYAASEILQVLQAPLENEQPRSARERLGKQTVHAKPINIGFDSHLTI